MFKILKLCLFVICFVFLNLNSVLSDDAILSYSCKGNPFNKKLKPFVWTFKVVISDNNFSGKHTYNSSFFKRKITRSFSGMSRFGKFFVDSKFDNVVVPNYEIKFERYNLKSTNGIELLKKGIKGREGNRNCELKLIRIIRSSTKDKVSSSQLSNKDICLKATSIEGSSLIKKKYVKEAQKRGLNCGLKNKKFDEAKKEKEKKLTLEKERKAIEEKKRKLAAEKKAKKQMIASERVLKKKLAEQERKKKLEQDKITKKIKDYKRQATNFYKDIEEFVKSGGKIDLVKLSKLFNVKPNPKIKWSKLDLNAYENLRQFMSSVSEFVTYEKQMIGERLKKSFALKDQSIVQLENNLDDLKGLMRKMFGSSDVPKITKMISDIENSLANFNQSQANKLIVQTTNYISSKLDKPKVVENKKTFSVKELNTQNVSWDKVKNDFTIQQRQFCQLTDSFFDDLDYARKSNNEIKVNIVHKERQEDLDALIPGGKINNWIFKVVKIDQVEDGSAAVVLSLQCKSFLGSGQVHTKSSWRKKSNKEWRATIPYNDRRYRELAKLNAGEFVVASGIMLEIGAYKPGQKETFYASQPIGEHPLSKGLNLKGELFIADLSYIAALN